MCACAPHRRRVLPILRCSTAPRAGTGRRRTETVRGVTTSTIDWKHRWLGGFCALAAVGGLPVRGPDYRAHPPLQRDLTLPAVAPASDVSAEQTIAAWSQALGGAPVVLARSVERARRLLLKAAGVEPSAPVKLPANATRALSEQALAASVAVPAARLFSLIFQIIGKPPEHASSTVIMLASAPELGSGEDFYDGREQPTSAHAHFFPAGRV